MIGHFPWLCQIYQRVALQRWGSSCATKHRSPQLRAGRSLLKMVSSLGDGSHVASFSQFPGSQVLDSLCRTQEQRHVLVLFGPIWYFEIHPLQTKANRSMCEIRTRFVFKIMNLYGRDTLTAHHGWCRRFIQADVAVPSSLFGRAPRPSSSSSRSVSAAALLEAFGVWGVGKAKWG
jgi:hypothetical protein